MICVINREWRRALSPQFPPFFLAGRFIRREVHFPANVADVPSGESRDIARFAFLSIAKRASIRASCLAVRRALPCVMENETRLEVLAIACFLEHEILRKLRAVVSHVK